MASIINRETLKPQLIFNTPIKISEDSGIVVHPVRMKDILSFEQFKQCLIVRKDSIFIEKQIIKMDYFEFLKFAHDNYDLEQKYKIDGLSRYYEYFMCLLSIVCVNQEITWNNTTLDIYVEGEKIDSNKFDTIRRLIIIQNDVDFDIDEFMNIETLKALERARELESKKKGESTDLEDYIDSMIVSMRVSEEYVQNLTIRKFWRYIKRINKHEEYQSYRSAELGGMVTFKEPLSHWMTTIEVKDKYDDLKVNEEELREKMG